MSLGQRVQRWADLVLAVLVLVMLSVWLVAWCALRRLWPRRQPANGRPPRMLQMVSGSIEGEQRRNALGRLTDTDYGWFEHVYHVYFYAPTAARQSAGPRHTLINWRLPSLEILRAAGWKRLHVALHEAAFLGWLARFIHHEGIAVIDAADPYVTGVNAWLGSLVTGVPYTVEIHRDYDLDYRLLGQPHFACFPSWQAERRVGGWVLRHAHRVIADHDCYARYARANGARPERIVKVRATSNLGRPGYALAEQPRPQARARYETDGRRLLVYVGRLDPDKFVEDLVPCLEQVVAHRRDVRLLLAGDGSLRASLLQAAGARGLSDHIRWLGSLPLPEVLDLFTAADVVVGTHLGATYLEAALCGAPLVAYDIDRHPEFIHDGETGMLVPFRDAQRLSEAVLRVLDDAALADRLRRGAKRRVLEQHRPEHYMEDMRRCFQELLGVAA